MRNREQIRLRGEDMNALVASPLLADVPVPTAHNPAADRHDCLKPGEIATERGQVIRCKTAAALEMAVRNAAKASPQDTNRAIAGFYFHRLLCRVFSEPEPRFVLKGGLGMLARVPDA